MDNKDETKKSRPKPPAPDSRLNILLLNSRQKPKKND
jgi:hypothetical protein